MGFKQLTYNDRLRIEVLYNKRRCTGTVIADTLGFHNSTIYRELKQGMCETLDEYYITRREYSADIAQKRHDEKVTHKGPALKIGHDHDYAAFLEQTIIKKKYSPAAALAEAKQQGFDTSISKTTLYRYIDCGLFLHLSNKHLPSGKRNPNPRKKVRRICFRHPLHLSIEARPDGVMDRREFEHWEMDTVVGKQRGKSTCLLVLTERKTRQEIVLKLPQRTRHHVVQAIDKLHRRYKSNFCRVFKTITVDNGGEFMDAEGIQKGGRTKLYYCHPFSSFERGSNENANKLIRRFIPKGTSIENFTHKQIETIERWMNNYPRSIHGYKTSQELYNAELLHMGLATA